MEHKIIEATVDHIEEIMKLWDKLMQIHENLDPGLFLNVDSDRGKNEFYYKNNISKDNAVLYVILSENQIIGFVSATIQSYGLKKICKIENIIVDEESTLKGYGKYFFEKVIGWTKQNKVDRIELNVFPNNFTGNNFFRKIGFKSVSNTVKNGELLTLYFNIEKD